MLCVNGYIQAELHCGELLVGEQAMYEQWHQAKAHILTYAPVPSLQCPNSVSSAFELVVKRGCHDRIIASLGPHTICRLGSSGEVMKIVVVGGTGLIGSKIVEKLKQKSDEAIAAAPNTGVNTITGEGLADALAGAQVVVDVANSPSFEIHVRY